jgi:NurA-like 5'-3' nuclease
VINEAYERLASDRQLILRKLTLSGNEFDKKTIEEVKNNWKEFTPSSRNRKKFAAIDGGEFHKELRVGMVYVVDAEILITLGEKVLEKEGDVRAGVFRPGNKAKERVGELMALLEAKLALNHGNKADWILMDGSIKKKVGEIREIDPPFEVRDDTLQSLDQSDEDLMLNFMVYEKQVLLSRLLERYGERTVWISKVSRGRELFKEEVSDAVLLETVTRSPGFSTVWCRKLTPTYLGIGDQREKLGESKVCSFYTRLEKGERVLRVDVTREVDEQWVKDLMNDLSSVSIRGYPYPLVQVHYDVKVSTVDRKRIMDILGLRNRRGVNWWPSQFS